MVKKTLSTWHAYLCLSPFQPPFSSLSMSLSLFHSTIYGPFHSNLPFISLSPFLSISLFLSRSPPLYVAPTLSLLSKLPLFPPSYPASLHLSQSFSLTSLSLAFISPSLSLPLCFSPCLSLPFPYLFLSLS